MNDDTESNLYTTALDHLVRRTIVATIGDTDLDLDQVYRLGDDVLACGRPTQHAGVTIDRNDVVTVWADGDDVAVATIPGIYAAYLHRADR